MAKQKAHIENWYRERCAGTNSYWLIGSILRHPNQTYFRGFTQHTSELVNFDEEAKTAETLNTIYTLGEPYKPVQLSEEKQKEIVEFMGKMFNGTKL